MDANPRRWAGLQHLRLHDPGPPRLWKIGYALTVCFLAALAGLAGLWLVALALLSNPKLPHSKVISLHDTVGVAQLVFASVAGAGALVALVMAYRRQRVAETTSALDRERWETTSAHDRTRLLNERFTTSAAHLGDQNAAVRLAGVHAMAGLADDWEENRQTCVDVLCAYLRMPYEPEPDSEAPATERLAFRGNREVRQTVIRLITAHLRQESAVSWQGLDLDFTGVVFDGGDFTEAQFSGGMIRFDRTEFSGPVNFAGANFSGGVVRFADAVFSGGEVNFRSAQFTGSLVVFTSAKFTGGMVWFFRAIFSGHAVHFGGTEFSGGEVSFDSAVFSGAEVVFGGSEFSGSEVIFGGSEFSGGEVSFPGAKFTGGTVDFAGAQSRRGQAAGFIGGTVDFSEVADWSHPPVFDWAGTPPQGVTKEFGSSSTLIS